jgi:hypothetical protein
MKLPEKQVRYIDRPDVLETFADALGPTSTFDGHDVRIELCVTRLDDIAPPKPITARKYTACRLILTPEVTLDLFNQLQGFINAMEKEGLLKRISQPPSGGTPPPVH